MSCFVGSLCYTIYYTVLCHAILQSTISQHTILWCAILKYRRTFMPKWSVGVAICGILAIMDAGCPTFNMAAHVPCNLGPYKGCRRLPRAS